MNTILYLCILTLALTSRTSSLPFDGINIIQKANESIRFYQYLQTTGSFGLIGKGVSGILNSGVKSDPDIVLDVNSFILRSKTTLEYNMVYSSFVKNESKINGDYFKQYFGINALCEYEEVNDEPGFQFGKDKVVGWINFAEYDFTVKMERVTNQTTSIDGKPFDFQMFYMNATSDNNLITVKYYVVGNLVELKDGQLLPPEVSHIQVSIQGYEDTSVNKKASGSTVCNLVNIFGCRSTGPSDSKKSKLALVTSYYNNYGPTTLSLNTQMATVSTGSRVKGKLSWDTPVADNTAQTPVISEITFGKTSKPIFVSKFVTSTEVAGSLYTFSFNERVNSITWNLRFGIDNYTLPIHNRMVSSANTNAISTLFIFTITLFLFLISF